MKGQLRSDVRCT